MAVGNIPYDVTEEQLIEICREVGPVVSFRSVLLFLLIMNFRSVSLVTCVYKLDL